MGPLRQQASSSTSAGARPRLAFAMMLFVPGCLDPREFPCERDEMCVRDGVDGQCGPAGYCAYPDDGCPSDLRYGTAAPPSWAGQCVESSGTAGTGTTSDGETHGETHDPTAGCGEPCDDPPGPCFESEGTCEGGTCVYSPKPQDSSCEGPDACVDGGRCDGDGRCVGGTPLPCDDPPDSCSGPMGTCDPETGACTYPPAQSGTACEDGDLCTQGDVCQGGRCTPGPSCESDDPCETGQCLEGGCVFTPLDDGASCGPTAAARCCSGTCVDISTDPAHCGGCNTACDPGQGCEPVDQTSECDPAPAQTSGRCTCSESDAQCPIDQVCRINEPAANRCAPTSEAGCSGIFVDVEQCPNFCAYP